MSETTKKNMNVRGVISLEKPYVFEGTSYDQIDLTALENATATDMVEVSRQMSNLGNTDLDKEYSLEYALLLSARMTQKPIEYFKQMPLYLAMKVKGRVLNFLSRPE